MGNTITQCCPFLAGAMDSSSDTSSLTTLHPCPGPNHAPVEERETCATCILSQALFIWVTHALRLQFLHENSLGRDLIYQNCYWKVREECWDGTGSIYYPTSPPTKARGVRSAGAAGPTNKGKSKASLEDSPEVTGLDEFRKFLAGGGVRKWVEQMKWEAEAGLGEDGGWGVVEGFPVEIVGKSAQRARTKSSRPGRVGPSPATTLEGGYTRRKMPWMGEVRF